MIDVLVPPVILLLILALLITILARAMKNTPSVKEDLENMRKASKKSKRLEQFSGSIKNKFSDMSKAVEKAASRKYKMTKKHQMEIEGDSDSKKTKMLQKEVLPEIDLNVDESISFDTEKDEEYEYEVEGERERYLVKQIESNPKNLTSYQQLGDYYMETNKFEEAKESYKYVLKIDPRNKKAQESMKKLDRMSLKRTV